MRHVMPFRPSVIFATFVVRALCYIFMLFPLYEQREGGGGCAAKLFFFFYIFSFFSRPRAGLTTRVKNKNLSQESAFRDDGVQSIS